MLAPRAGALLALATLPLLGAVWAPSVLPVVLAFDLLVVLAAVLDGAALRSRLSVDLSRRTAGKLAVGAPNKVSVSLRNRAGGDVRLVVRDAYPDGMAATPPELVLEAGPFGEGKAIYSLVPPSRGKFRFGDLHFRARAPLGLSFVEGALPAGAEARVYPDLRAASRLLLASAIRELSQLGVRRLRRDGQGSEFARLREYVPGDPRRDVDWKATARRLTPVTRVYETERSQTVVLCVDAGRAMAARVGALQKLDLAINAALFLAFVAIRNGDRVGVAVFADGISTWVPPAQGRAQYRKIVDAVYAVEPARTLTDHRALFRDLSARVRRRALVTVFTDVLDEEQGRGLSEPMRILARRHLALAVCPRDPSLDRLGRTVPPGPDEAFQQAVAAELLAERERVLLSLTEGGVHVLESSPDDLALAVVNRYLELKRRALL